MTDQYQTPNLPEQPGYSQQQSPSQQQPYGQQPYGQQYLAPPVAPKTNTLAIVSLVSSFFISLVGVITGHMALNQIKRTGEGGRGLALAGTIIGYVGIGFGLIAGFLAIAFSAVFFAIFAAIFGASSSAIPDFPSVTAPSSQVATAPMPDPVGVVGAVNFDEGFITMGSGPAVVDYFFDPMCPYCAVFHETNSVAIDTAVEQNDVTLRLHTLSFLDPQSQGTEYSSRAGSAITCVAALDESWLPYYLDALFAGHPDEGTEGLTSEELSTLLLAGTLSSDTEACIVQDSYTDWAKTVNNDVMSGTTSETLGLPDVTGTPTVFLDGTKYEGPLDDAAAFETFLTGK